MEFGLFFGFNINTLLLCADIIFGLDNKVIDYMWFMSFIVSYAILYYIFMFRRKYKLIITNFENGNKLRLWVMWVIVL